MKKFLILCAIIIGIGYVGSNARLPSGDKSRVDATDKNVATKADAENERWKILLPAQPNPGKPDATEVVLWKNQKVMIEGYRIIAAGAAAANTASLMERTSCLANGGSKVVVTEGRRLDSDVIVIDGPQAGCTGTVNNDSLKSGPREETK